MPFFERIASLERTRRTFAIATVVGRRSPVSSHLGDRALIFADGQMEGFVGGSCSREIVRRHALGALRSHQPMLLHIRPEARSDDEQAQDSAHANAERVTVPMSCSSEGAVDVYIEPRVPPRRLLVIGLTPVAQALTRVAKALDYDVVSIVVESELPDLRHALRAANSAPSDEFDPSPIDADIVELRELPTLLNGLDNSARGELSAVVASQGHYDEIALEALLKHSLGFIALVASRRRAATVAGVLSQQGIAADRIAAIHNPAGLDIGARTPGDVAVSILAEMIGLEAAKSVTEVSAELAAPVATAVDPICGMDVDSGDALYRLAFGGHDYYFCGAHCRTSFAADPERYLVTIGKP